MATIFEQLKTEHVEMRRLAHAAEGLESTEQTARQPMLQELKLSLIPHAKGEEATLYREMEKDESLRVDALEAVDEHALIERALQTLEENLDGDADEWHAAAQVLRETVEHHLKEEEEKTFPEAEKTFDVEMQTRLLQEYLTAAEKWKHRE